MSRKNLIVALVLMLFIGGITAHADGYFQFDPALNIPFQAGISLSGIDASTGLDFMLVFPELGFHYVFDTGLLKFGLGVRAFTFIVESIIYPNAFLEADLGPVALNASLGGGALFFFGLWNASYIGDPADPAILVFPDISAEFKLSDWFRLGIGCWMLTDFKHFMEYYAYFPYVKAHFRIKMQDNSKKD